MLAPGLHLYVYEYEEPFPPAAHAGPRGRLGTSDVPMGPVGVIGWNGHYYPEDRVEGQIHRTALHEIGHVLGIGTNDRWDKWVKAPDPEKPWNTYFTDPEVIAVFDRMGGTDFPATTPKITLGFYVNRGVPAAHWDWCTGVPDIMSTLLSPSTVTELTMVSLADGYVYDPATAPGLKMDPEAWNRPGFPGGCRGRAIRPAGRRRDRRAGP